VRNGNFREVKEATRMKIFIFLIFIVSIVSVLVWYWRKSQAEADLARRKSTKRVRKEKQEAITAEDVTWPTVGLRADGDPEEVTDYEGPSMRTIEFVPPE
jgi:hypothetical protein